MLCNFHTHTSFCDGKNTPEEIVIKAIEKGFCSIGFSGHAYTDFDVRYCMKDAEGYIAEINCLKEKYKKDIQIYLGVEEDAFCITDRSKFDYIIGSSHYLKKDDNYYSIDSSYDLLKKALSVFENNTIKLAETYYKSFCDYIEVRKPDIIGHFDLITKFDELDTSIFSEDERYNEISLFYARVAAKSGCIFEVNTGAISRGYRSTPYPSENILYELKKCDAGLILSSDSHSADTIDYNFDESKAYLRYIGFKKLFALYNNEFIKYDI